MPNQKQQPIDDEERRFFTPGQTAGAIIKAADELCRNGNRIYGVVLTSSQPLNKRIARLTESFGKVRGFEVTGTGPFLIRLHKRDKEGKPIGKYAAFLWQADGSDAVYYLTCQPREDFLHLFEMVHSFLQPDVCRLFLRTPHLEQTLRQIVQQNPKTSIKVKEYVARKLIKSRGHGGEVDTKVQYTNEDFATVFRELEEEGQWLSSVKVRSDGDKLFTGRISRQSSFSCSQGFSEFFDSVVMNLERTVQQFKKLFQGRDRSKSEEKRSLPLKIVYKRCIFADKSQNYRLIDVLEKVPNTALSVFHPNPYLHASLIDYADGSTYTILVTTTTGILISPERRATPQSLSRLCDHICDHFEEGEVVEYRPYEHR